MEKYKHSILFGMRLLFFLLLITIFYIGWQIGYSEATFFYAGNYLVIAAYALVVMMFMIIYGGWRVGEQRLINLIYSGILSLIFANGLMYLILCLIAREMLPFGEIFAILLAQVLLCILGNFLMNRAYFSLRKVRQVAVIYGGYPEDMQTIDKMNAFEERFHVACIIDSTESFAVICETLQSYESVLLCHMNEEKRNRLFNYCYRENKRINVIPDPMDIVLHRALHTQIMDVPILFCRKTKLKSEQKLTKRIMDILLVSIGILLTSPLFLLAALCIKLEDGGPVFFRQTRLTENGRAFSVLKFRSMSIDAEKNGAMMAEKGDSRITKTGRILRAMRIDELPQFFNILHGDMSFVGPRPERPEFYEAFCRDLPEFSLRLNVKAGLTGYAQIYGRYNTTPKNKLNLDLFYIESYSLLLDLRLIFSTIKILFMKESTDGFDSTFNQKHSKEEISQHESKNNR